VPPFEPVGPAVYGAKVKNLLVGMPLTNDELAALVADPKALASLIDQWMTLPAYRDRMLVFFKQAFQQTQVTPTDYIDSLNFDARKLQRFPFVRVMEEMFPRTVLALLDEGRPFTEVVTTRRFMMTSTLVSLLAYADAVPQTDDGKDAAPGWWILQQYPTFAVTIDVTPVPLSETLDPASPNFMHWYDPKPYPGAMPGDKCYEPRTFNRKQAITVLGEFLFGQHLAGCGTTDPQFTDADWNDWRMVTVRARRDSSEPRTLFWDAAAVRAASELVVETPRVGFMTTPAFFANWPTNDSNQARVTTNQATIVALGLAFDDRGITVPVQSSAGDTEHAQPGTVCYACHQTLDPMRDFYRQSYTYFYSKRLDPTADMIPMVGTFSVAGSDPVMGTGVGDLAAALAAHPRFAVAWTQKLCRFANSSSCSEMDPEFARVAKAFADSHFDWKTLVRELFSSPLVTYAAPTPSATESGAAVSIARHDSLCTSLSNRLGVGDLCGLYGTVKDKRAANLTTAVPTDGYARGAEEPLMPRDPNLFFTSATENLCALLASRVVDAGAASLFKSADKDAALRALVATVMGVAPSDPRSPGLLAILSKHDEAAVTAGASPTDALRSTFVVACSSPLSVSMGL
jgi:hypothetical protein